MAGYDELGIRDIVVYSDSKHKQGGPDHHHGGRVQGAVDACLRT